MEILEVNLTLSAKKKRSNPNKERKLKSFERQATLNNEIGEFCCFNFKYFRTEKSSQSFSDWQDEKILADLMEKLKSFSQCSLKELKQRQTLKVYGKFPRSDKTEFDPPLDLPEDGIKWASLRLTSRERLIGFLVSDSIEKIECCNLKNTFYVVFLDKNHLFYLSKKKNT